MDDTNRKFAIISVDTNDGDTVTHTIEVKEYQALILNNVAYAIKKFENYEVEIPDFDFPVKHEHNFPQGECLRTDMGEMSVEAYYVEYKKTITSEDLAEFLELMPYCEYGFHTVTEIKILAVIGEIKLI